MKTMRNDYILLILFSISFSIFSNAQSRFEIEYGQGSHFRPYSVFETSSGDYILFTPKFSYPDLVIDKSYFIKINQDGQVVNEVGFQEDSAFVSSYLMELFEIDEQLVGVGVVRNKDDLNDRQLCKIKLFPDLLTTEVQYFPFFRKNIYAFQTKRESNGFVFFGSYFENDHSTLFGGRMADNGDILDFNTSISHDYFNDFDIRKDSSGFILYGFDFCFIDSSFNYRHKKPIPVGTSPQGSFANLNDTSLIFSCKYSEPVYPTDVDRVIGVGKTGADYGACIVDYFGTGEDTVDVPAPYYSLDFVDKEHIYVGGTLDIGGFFGVRDSRFVLAKYDSLLNRKWLIELGEHGYNYIMIGFIATTDRGCLMYGHRYDYINDIPEFYAVKVDENGEIVLISAIPVEENPVFSIFPNPFTNEISISLPDDITSVQLQIVNVSGIEVYKNGAYHSSRNSIDVSYLASGVYFYQLQDINGHLLKSGKLIKN